MERGYAYAQGMVLRTVYLPRELDDKLRQIAYEERKSKNEIIRTFLNTALDSHTKQVQVAEQTYAASAVAT